MELVINDRIRNRKVDFFNNFKLSLKFDAVASPFSFGFYFNPDILEHKELACIGHYHICKVTHNGELLVTGNVLSQSFTDAPTKQLVSIGGYSLPGVLEDSDIPVDLPIETSNLSIADIAKQLLQPFGISHYISASVADKMSKVLEKSTARAGQSIKNYLAELCAQQNITISHNEYGALLFTAANANAKPVMHFEPQPGVTTMQLHFNGQGMHSHITVVKEADSEGGNAGQSTIRNPYVINTVYRPRVIEQTSGTDIDTEQAAKNALAEELKNLRLTINTSNWTLPNGKILRPNQTITVLNPEIYLYKKCTWFIESIDYEGDAEKTTATLNCVLPEVYNGQMPEYLFKGINLH